MAERQLSLKPLTDRRIAGSVWDQFSQIKPSYTQVKYSYVKVPATDIATDVRGCNTWCVRSCSWRPGYVDAISPARLSSIIPRNFIHVSHLSSNACCWRDTACSSLHTHTHTHRRKWETVVHTRVKRQSENSSLLPAPLLSVCRRLSPLPVQNLQSRSQRVTQGQSVTQLIQHLHISRATTQLQQITLERNTPATRYLPTAITN